MSETPAVANRLVAAVAAQDFDGIIGLLSPDARFRYLIPKGSTELRGAAEVAATFAEWFGDVDTIEVESVQVEPLPDRTSARYRFRLHEDGQWEVVEQQTYIDVDEEGRIAGIDLLCSGFRPIGGTDQGGSCRMHRFDAGTLGCGDGLAQEFRRRI